MKILSAACSRRDILKVASSSTLITLFSSFAIGCSPRIADLNTIADRMTDALKHPADARKLGSIYLARLSGKQHPGPEQLTRELLQRLKLNPEKVTVDSLPSLDRLLSAQVRQDFVDENVVIIDSWMLSKTEIMLCELAAVRA